MNPFGSHRARAALTLSDSRLDLALPTAFNSNYEEADTNPQKNHGSSSHGRNPPKLPNSHVPEFL